MVTLREDKCTYALVSLLFFNPSKALHQIYFFGFLFTLKDLLGQGWLQFKKKAGRTICVEYIPL